ncbi:MAG: hypothetical protein H6908_00650 [Hyphomicrobiales bacterium]|nr:hypothetical protein [Hyphomicrobiales bacterium]
MDVTEYKELFSRKVLSPRDAAYILLRIYPPETPAEDVWDIWCIYTEEEYNELKLTANLTYEHIHTYEHLKERMEYLAKEMGLVFGFCTNGINTERFCQWAYDSFFFLPEEFIQAARKLEFDIEDNKWINLGYEHWARMDAWTVTVFLKLLCRVPLANIISSDDLSILKKIKPKNFSQYYKLRDVLYSSYLAGKIRPLGEERGYSDKEFNEVSFNILELLNWTKSKKLNFLPPKLLEFTEKYHSYGSGYKELSSDRHEEKTLRPNQRHRERCRAIAAMKWAANQSITITAMTEDSDIINFGCEGKLYRDSDTVRNWIKDLCPCPKPGRPPNNKILVNA